MRITLDITDELIHEFRAIAAREGTSFCTVVEGALRREVERRGSRPEWSPRLDLVYGGDGLTDEAAHLTWDEIRDLSRWDHKIMAQIREDMTSGET